MGTPLPPKKTELTSDPAHAGSILQSGGIVVFPTETVYGIGASSLYEKSCKKIYEIKNRPSDNPLIVHVSTVEEIYNWGYVRDEYKELLISFSPGPISYILKKKGELYSSGLETIAIRVPSHRQAREILSVSGPVSAPSANRSGKPSITRLKDILDEFMGEVDCIFLGEEPEIGMESTVLDLTGEIPIMLRPGFITRDDILQFTNLESATGNLEKKKSPGLRYKHYSPEAPVILFPTGSEINFHPEDALIGFTELKKLKLNMVVKNNKDYMFQLYNFLIQCDRLHVKKIYCEYPREDKYKIALVDRLSRAAGLL